MICLTNSELTEVVRDIEGGTWVGGGGSKPEFMGPGIVGSGPVSCGRGLKTLVIIRKEIIRAVIPVLVTKNVRLRRNVHPKWSCLRAEEVSESGGPVTVPRKSSLGCLMLVGSSGLAELVVAVEAVAMLPMARSIADVKTAASWSNLL